MQNNLHPAQTLRREFLVSWRSYQGTALDRIAASVLQSEGRGVILETPTAEEFRCTNISICLNGVC